MSETGNWQIQGRREQDMEVETQMGRVGSRRLVMLFASRLGVSELVRVQYHQV